mmetsp:Transcript_85622/g.239126  ORF Transcript_85622/g.239126 Transcript_85622/m.239126 type:complete len:274 (+) Transcript_85622:528-1349(+)
MRLRRGLRRGEHAAGRWRRWERGHERDDADMVRSRAGLGRPSGARLGPALFVAGQGRASRGPGARLQTVLGHDFARGVAISLARAQPREECDPVAEGGAGGRPACGVGSGGAWLGLRCVRLPAWPRRRLGTPVGAYRIGHQRQAYREAMFFARARSHGGRACGGTDGGVRRSDVSPLVLRRHRELFVARAEQQAAAGCSALRHTQKAHVAIRCDMRSRGAPHRDRDFQGHQAFRGEAAPRRRLRLRAVSRGAEPRARSQHWEPRPHCHSDHCA